jgi:hypothetical protein
MARLADELGGRVADGRRPDHERRLAVGEHEVGGEGELGQPGAQGGMVPKGLTMTSPASRQASAQAMTHDSARVTPGSPIMPPPLGHVGPVLVVVDVDVALGEGLPLGGVGGRGAYSFWNGSSRP